ncbi:MAG: glycosyltransferase [Eubacteriaceae bacterium]|nr:glycosyltransferase [Eubacteriaceae bacterium]
MKVLTINLGNYGSTGTIVRKIGELAIQKGFVYKSAYGKYPKYNEHGEGDILIGGRVVRKLHVLFAHYTGYNEFFSFFETLRLIGKIERFSPDLIHLHNLHGWYLNIPVLFNYLKRKGTPVVWTLHDCWSFTGHCAHFTMAKCDKWIEGCHDCPQIDSYPETIKDRSAKLWKCKKKWFTGLTNMTIVTPSDWLAGLVSRSFMKEYPLKVIKNGIDLDVFKPTPSDFRKRYNCEGKFILLGVAFDWGEKKGFDIFIELARRLDKAYQIVLVGTDNETEKLLPESIISINKTQNQRQLAEIYTAADLFVNPTREEVLGLVNIEATACGTPVLTFKTGGCPECIDDTCGKTVECDDIDSLLTEIENIKKFNEFNAQACVRNAERFDMRTTYENYIKLYESVLGVRSDRKE